MRTVLLSCGVALLIASTMWLELFSQQTAGPQIGSGSETQVMSVLLPTGVQQIVVVDSRQQTMAVYQIDPQQGKIQLRSVRSLRWDLVMEEFNATAPKPSEMRLLKP